MTSPFLGGPETPPSPPVTLCHLFEVPPLPPCHLFTVIIIGQPTAPLVIIICHRHKTPPMSLVSSKKVDILYGQPLNILVNYFLAKWFTFYFVIIGIKTLNCLPIPIYFCSLMTSPFSDTPPPPCHLLVTFLEVPPLPPFLWRHLWTAPNCVVKVQKTNGSLETSRGGP